jgi:signal transduction histidine kinase
LSVALAWLFVGAFALGLGVLEWVASPKDVPLALATDIAAGWAFCVAGVLAWGGRRPRAIALLLGVTGFTWLLGALVPSMLDLYRGPLVHLLISYPTGRVNGRLPRGVVLVAYLSGVFGQLQLVQSIAPLLFVISALVAVRTAQGTTGPQARGRASGAAGAVAVAAASTVLTVGTLAGWMDPDTGRWIYALVLGATGLFLAADLRWGGWARDAVARVVIDLGDSDEPATLRGRIADALGDRSLLIGYPAGGAGEYVDETGRRLDVAEPGPGRSLTTLEVDGERVGILIRDGQAETDEALVDGVAEATRLVLANVRLQNQARQRIQDLASSRLRLVEAADAERSRIHQELDIGVGQRLTKAEALLSGLAEDGVPSDATRELLDDVHSVTAELSDFAAGIGSGSLLADGLRRAVTGLVQRSPIPIDIDIPADRWPTLVETTAYFVLSEGLANAAKHAHASRITVHVTRRPVQLDLEILDDGIGGADTAGGSGIRGLADRVEAIGGFLRVEDRVSGGTRLVATLPLMGTHEPPGDAI